MKANVSGYLSRLRKITSYKDALLEAVANSIQACADVEPENAEITVEIRLKLQAEPTRKGHPTNDRPIESIRVTDNGEGFTDENFESFCTMDTDRKAARFGCKGIGRFLWLKAFRKVVVESVYRASSGEKYFRRFEFSTSDIENESTRKAGDDEAVRTTISLQSMIDGMEQTHDVTAEEIVHLIIGHFLWDFASGTVPKIRVVCAGESLCANDVFEGMRLAATEKQTFNLAGYDFEFLQQTLKFKSKNGLRPGIYYCAGGRVVCKASTALDPKIESLMPDADGADRMFLGLVKSRVLDELVGNERNVIEWGTEGSDDHPSEKAILKRVEEICSEYLKTEFERLAVKSNARLQEFVDTEAPEYKAFLNRRRDSLYVRPDASVSDVREYFREEFHKYERAERREVDDWMAVDWSGEEAESKIRELSERIEPILARDLVKLAASRRFYLRMYEKAMSLSEEGGFRKEKAIHSLLYPMNTDDRLAVGTDKQNLWLIDERLTFVHCLTSDQRTDRAALKLFAVGTADNAGELYIIEFKRPGHDDCDLDENPISQVLDYVDELRAGGVTAADGTEITGADKLPIYCFIVAHITPTLRKQCRNSGLQLGASGDYFFGVVNGVYFEVMSVNSLYKKAKERNHALLTAAGLDNP
ncbi:hypothetical protein SUTMEG_15940 [Sutterella megalosphaeroides]|uniref:ATP-binding protein n=2 Tax=Sutterella megalosphaeroides TaxID=2494234 RepID=A0A2Z6IAZ5_9BURK|nr:hypothetical protein SUTMEG_15940 [Sutterella megalosphaeroides]